MAGANLAIIGELKKNLFKTVDTESLRDKYFIFYGTFVIHQVLLYLINFPFRYVRQVSAMCQRLKKRHRVYFNTGIVS
jgi:hypothetical protein